MAAVVTFDPINRRIVEISASGDNELNLFEIYSEWKEWVKIGDNAKHSQAFRTVGGDPTSATGALGVAYFLLNNWRIRPAELSHKLIIVGDLFTDPFGFSAFVDTLGAFTVNTETRVSNLTSIQSISDIELAVAAIVGNADISLDDQTITVLDASLATLRQLSLSVDGRTRRVL